MGTSRVPPWPAWFNRRRRLTHATTSWLDGPEGLSRLIRPNRMCWSTVLFSGGQPKAGSVSSSILMSSFCDLFQGACCDNRFFLHHRWSSFWFLNCHSEESARCCEQSWGRFILVRLVLGGYADLFDCDDFFQVVCLLRLFSYF